MIYSEKQSAHHAKRRHGLALTLCIFAAAVLAVLPMAQRGISCGHDLNFHLLSWMETARAWHAGLWYPHWIEHANYLAGEPRLVFYPPASWMLGAALGSVSPWTAAPALYVFVVLLGCGASMYWLAREFLPEKPAIAAACLYATNPYALFVVYERSAFGELLAAVWMPLIVLFAARRSRSTVPLALAIAAVWLTDIPAAVMASYMLAILALMLAISEKSVRPVLRASAGVLLGLGLAAFYILPALYEQRWIEVGRALLYGMRVEDSFLFEHTRDSVHDAVLRTASWILLLEAGVAAGAILLIYLNGRSGRVRTPRSLLVAFAVLLGLILLFQFPFSDILWRHAPELRFLQFPWRWLLALSIIQCLLVGEAAGTHFEKRTGAQIAFLWLGTAAVVLSLVFTCARLFAQPCDDEDAVPAQVTAFHSGPGVEGTDEYTPSDADNSAIQQGLPFLRFVEHPTDDSAAGSKPENPEWHRTADAREFISVTVTNKNPEAWSIDLKSRSAGFAVFRLMDYPAWEVTWNGTAATRETRDDGLLTIPITEGANRIEIRWRNTVDVFAGRALSAIALAMLAGIAWTDRSKRKRPAGVAKRDAAEIQAGARLV